MIFLLIGHRGTGKSQFLKLLRSCLSSFQQESIFFDLDTEIENSTGSSILELFEKHGEKHFRELEEKNLFRCLYESMKSQKIVIVALGAGYIGKIPEKATVIWLKRKTDALGRIFLDRPRLNKNLMPMEEFFQRYEIRNQHYQNLTDEILCIPENLKSVRPWLPLFWGLQPGDISGALTLMPSQLTDKQKTREYLSKRMSWGIKFFELRNDLLSIEQIFWIKEVVPESLLLLSIRRENEIPFFTNHMDWALELGNPPDSFLNIQNLPQKEEKNKKGKPSDKNEVVDDFLRIISLHTRKESLKSTLKFLSEKEFGFHKKLAIEIHNWDELKRCHDWWLEDPENRSFLPISNEGRWEWYRLLHKYKMKVNFFREDESTAKDQPYFTDWSDYQYFQKNEFGAILGDPIEHSWTPEEHRDFWQSKGCNPLRIKINRDEFIRPNINFLIELGLRYAAVTSPLKELAYEICDDISKLAKELNSVNSLKVKEGKLIGHNTDYDGFKNTIGKLASSLKVAVWGGGGTIPVIRKIFPEATFFSARSGEIRDVEKMSKPKTQEFDILIWAVGRNHLDTKTNTNFPNDKISFSEIWDLNYSENSPGKELALLRDCKYKSGANMFFEQAKLQREFYSISRQ